MPDKKIENRRTAATAAKVAAIYGERLDVHDPQFNVREIAKQLALLEGHFFHPGKLCPDCVRKHLLTVEALAEEGVALAAGKPGPCDSMAEAAKRWAERFNDGAPPAELGAAVRAVRKFLVATVPDPRREMAAGMVAAKKFPPCGH